VTKHLEGLAPDYRMALALERIADALDKLAGPREFPMTPEADRQRIYELARAARNATRTALPKEDPKNER
jgi:hypothetical protein